MLTEDNPRVRDAGLYLATLHPNLCVEERIEVRYRRGENSPMRRKFCTTVCEAAHYAVSLGETHDVYAGVAARCGEDGTKAGVGHVTALWVDVDAKGRHTRMSRLSQLTDLSYQPSVMIWTGGGYHAYWMLREPAKGPEALNRAERVMRLLAQGLDGDPVHDRSRVMRVPGTFNHKYGESRLVYLEFYDVELRYGLHELHEMAEALACNADYGTHPEGGQVPRHVLSDQIREGRRNVALTSVAGSLRNRGLDEDTISVVLLEVNRLRCEPLLGEQEVRRIARSVSRYPAGRTRYGRSSARRIHGKEGR